MKTLKLIALAAFALLFSQCKTTAPTAPSIGSASVLEVAQTLDTTETILLHYADSTNGNAHTALQRTADWLRSQPNIQTVSVVGNSYLYFTLKSGLTGMYYLNETDSSGKSRVRGGNGGGGKLHHWDVLSLHKITNKEVLFFAPVFDEFYDPGEFQTVLDKISNSPLGLNVTVKKDAECTSDVVDHFGDYGLVIMDTHGAPNGFLIGSEIKLSTSEEGEKQEIDVDLGKSGYDKFQAGQIMLARSLVFDAAKPGWQKKVMPHSTKTFGVVLTSNYLTELPKLTNTVLFGNMCFSGQGVQTSPPFLGAQTPIRTAFMNLAPISYFGYAYANNNAASVSNPFAKQMENTMITQLITNTDSTGHCYLASDGTEYSDAEGLNAGLSTEKLFFKHFGADDFSYNDCIKDFTDERDGQKYKAVCIGKQNWMAENLRYNAPGSFCYNDSSSNCDKYGRLYDWQTVMNGAASSSANPSGVQGICPKGWHLPSQGEFQELLDFLGGKAGKALKSTSGWAAGGNGTNTSGFNALPAGFRNGNGSSQIYTRAEFWSTTLKIDPDVWDLQLQYYTDVGVVNYIHSFEIPCRCLKD